MVGSVVPRAGAGPRAGNPGHSRYYGRGEGRDSLRGGVQPGRGRSLIPAEFLLPRVPIYAPGRGHPAVPFAALLARTAVAFPAPLDSG